MFTAMLEEQWRFRVEQVAQLSAANALPDKAETAAQREVREVVLRGARLALREIQAARTRLVDGSYGRCVYCTAELPLERLEVQPAVASCLTCQREVTG
jgi:RNA polymerase-binding transcription factor DksA